jgi:sugar/nucleoside kinase (ribokinase family)
MSGNRALIVGDVIDDLIVVPVGPVRPDTDTTSRITRNPGGSAANTAAWLGSLGTSVDFVGRVGAGDTERHARELADFGVTPHLSEDPRLGTGAIVIIVDGQHRTMLTDRGANATLDPAAVTDALLAHAGILHLTGYSLFDALSPHAIADLVSRAHALGVVVSLDPGSTGFIADYGVEAFRRAISGIDVLLPNLDEGRMLGGLDIDAPARVVAETLLDLAPTVLLTCGAAGVTIASRASDPTRAEATFLELAAEPVTTVDPTGAGDAFTAGFLAARLTGADLPTAAAAGHRVAATAVTQVGGRPGTRSS